MNPAIEDGICLRRVDYGEADAIVTFLTRERGKLGCFAKGVKRANSRNAPVCQLFAVSRLQLVEGKRLPLLAQSELLDSFYPLREDVWRTAYATFACELCDRALPDHEPAEAVFELLLTTLHQLAPAGEPEALIHSFELRLMATLGYQPVLDHCARCGGGIEEQCAVFCPAAGGLIHAEHHDPREEGVVVTPRVVKALRRLLQPDEYGLDLLHTHIPPPLATALREALAAHRRCYLETEPRSVQFLEQLRRLEPPV